MNPFLTCSPLPHPLHRSPIRSPHRQSHCRPIWAIYAALKPSALELVHRASTFRVLGGSRKRASRWTPGYVKLLLSPRHSRGITQVYLSTYGSLPRLIPCSSRLSRSATCARRAIMVLRQCGGAIWGDLIV